MLVKGTLLRVKKGGEDAMGNCPLLISKMPTPTQRQAQTFGRGGGQGMKKLARNERRERS